MPSVYPFSTGQPWDKPTDDEDEDGNRGSIQFEFALARALSKVVAQG